MTATAKRPVSTPALDLDIERLQQRLTDVVWDELTGDWAIYRNGSLIGWSATKAKGWARIRETAG